jgi:hypothetical protein
MDLTTKATLKAWIDPPITGTTQDTALDGLISRASAVILEELPDLIPDAPAAVTEKRNGIGNQMMLLRKYPATSVTSVTIGTTVVPASVGGSSGWVFDDHTGVLHLIGYVFASGVQNVAIVYEAGMAAASDRRLKSLEHACLVTCASWWKRRARVDVEVSGVNGVSFTNYSAKDLPSEAWTIIDSLLRKGMVYA